MKVELAGFNVPLKVFEQLPEEEKERATPEVISAAYARLSRSTKNVDELIEEAIKDTVKARRSVTNILGMGHHSIADHAIFNFNIQGISRLLVESIQRRRLAGYTEKSQRYVTLKGDYIRPKEFSKEDLSKFEQLIRVQNSFYFKNNEKLFEYLKKKFPDKDKKLIEGMAKEDCRFSLALATQTQLGCSYTGQTAELAIRELKYGELEEERELSKLLYEAIVKKAPSLIQLADPELFKQLNPGKELKDDDFKYTRKNLQHLVERTFREYETKKLASFPMLCDENVALLSYNNLDKDIIAALLHKNSKKPFSECCVIADLLIAQGKAKDFIKEALKYISEHDKVPREFETSILVYEITISASGFAQLKRHRMNTLLAQPYDPELGYVIPESIAELGAKKELEEVCDKSSELYYTFLPKYGKAAEYCLTNAHKRRVILATNLRQLYHISRTREDEHAQWEIRSIANKMTKLAKQVAPITTLLLGGKHEFKKIRKQVYNG